MAPPLGRQLVDATVGISCHAWSPKRDAVAYAPNSHEPRIATYQNKEFTDKWKLNEHDMLISAMDWHPETNFLVTCSHDRNAFVWNYDSAEDTWKQSQVILGIERAALDVLALSHSLRAPSLIPQPVRSSPHPRRRRSFGRRGSTSLISSNTRTKSGPSSYSRCTGTKSGT